MRNRELNTKGEQSEGDLCHSCLFCEGDDASLCRLKEDIPNVSELVRAAASYKKTYCPNYCYPKRKPHRKSPKIH